MSTVSSSNVSEILGSALPEAGDPNFSAKNGTQKPLEQFVSVPELVSDVVTNSPNALALSADNEKMTYAELNARANQLAHCLRKFGVGPDVVVGLCIKRSLEEVVGALAIMKAGGAYLPLDPDSPPERLAFMLSDAQTPVLITQRCIAETLPASGKWQNVILSLDELANAEAPGGAPEIGIAAENLAYVIYTSGSSGHPKGVQIAHGSLLNLVHWHNRAFEVRAADRATHLAGLGFDAAVWELWPYLVAGASVHLVAHSARTSAETLRRWLVEQGITIGFVPTPLAESLMKMEWPPETSLRLLLTGGDTLHSYPSATLPFKLVNNYGPTECAVVATSGIVWPNVPQNTLPPIGRPIDNTEIYILDEKLQQVSDGEAGELHVAGAGLARGYLNRPELTEAKFIPNPFSSNRGARMYRTGDLARYLPDGQLAFLGRIDEQIKIRGYRIEPDEIVSVLNAHPTIHASAVVAQEDNTGDKRLVAYLVAASGSKLDRNTVQEFLRTQLPDYMIPAVFVELDSLPLTSNGKVNRTVLPAPDDENTLKQASSTTPHTIIQQRMAKIVSALLKVNEVGPDDNFFLLGGHSLLGTQLIARIRDTFDVEIALRVLFEQPTVRELAGEIERLLMLKIESMSEDEAQRALSASAAAPPKNVGTLPAQAA